MPHDPHRILVTGATGFVGRPLCSVLAHQGFSVRAAVRGASTAHTECVPIGDISPTTNWDRAVDGIDTIIHLAARVHVMRETAADPLAEFRKVNVQPTLQLAKTAAARGVQRLIFLSSIKVNGEGTISLPYSESSAPAPQDAYAISKFEAEQGLMDIARSTGLEVVIVRPPLVYGPEVKGNFRRLLSWAHRGLPLPLGGASNRRSLIGVENLVSALIACVREPQAANQTFLVSDNEDLSTADLLRRAAAAMNRPARLFRLPESALAFAAMLAGQKAAYDRLFGSLVIDSSKIRNLLAWFPPVSVDGQLASTAKWFLGEAQSPHPTERTVLL